MNKWGFLAVFIAAFWMGKAVVVFAHPTESRSLDFGKFAMRNNDAQHSIVMQPNGTQTNPPAIVSFFNGTSAIFSFTGFPPSTALLISIPDTVVSPSGAGEVFDLINFTWTPDPPTTNASGDLTLNVGATLRTSGNSVLYEDSNYTGTYSMTFGW